MNFGASVVTSGNTVLQGFSLDGKFSNVEPTPNYVLFQWLNSDGNQNSKFILNWDEDFYLELVSINGGSNNSIGNWESYLNIPNNSNFFIWQSSFQNMPFPYNFPKGTLINPNSRNLINLNNSTSWLNIIARPISPIIVNSLSQQ